MSSKDKGLTKAEKRWQRHLREVEAAPPQTQAPTLDTEDDETPEDREAVLRFGKKLTAHGNYKALPTALGVAKERYGVKLSAALLDVCEPLLAEAEGDPAIIRKAVMFGVLGWNMACRPDAPIDDLLSKLTLDAGGKVSAKEMAKMFRTVVEDMKARKLELYPEINMLIMEHEVVFRNGAMQVNVAGAEVPAVNATPQRKGFLERMRGLMR